MFCPISNRLVLFHFQKSWTFAISRISRGDGGTTAIKAKAQGASTNINIKVEIQPQPQQFPNNAVLMIRRSPYTPEEILRDKAMEILRQQQDK